MIPLLPLVTGTQLDLVLRLNYGIARTQAQTLLSLPLTAAPLIFFFSLLLYYLLSLHIPQISTTTFNPLHLLTNNKTQDTARL